MKQKFTLARLIVLLCLFAGLIFTAQSQYILNGSASESGNDCYILTPDLYGQGGSVWYQNFMDISEDFDMTFQVYLGSDDGGADGVAFVIQPNSTGLGGSGGGIGYLGISPSIAVEYDTWQNDDPVYDHISVQRNGDVNYSGAVAGPVQASSISTDIEDGLWHSTRIVWDASTVTLTVYFDDVLRLTYTDDIVTNTFGGNPAVYWGFTGATGGAKNLQQFCITSLEFQEALAVNVTKTDASCKDADDGTATVISVVGGEPPYTFNGWSNGSFDLSISGLAPGSYSASYSDNTGDVALGWVEILEPDSVLFTYTVLNHCDNGSLADIKITATGGTPPYQYSDDGGSNFQPENIFSDEQTGSYNLLVKDANDCLSSVSNATVSAVNPLALVATPWPASEGNCNGSVNLTPSGGSPPYSYAAFSYPFSNAALNASLFTIRNGNFTEGGGSLRCDNQIDLYTDWDNSIETSAIFPRVTGNSYEASFNCNYDSYVYFGFTNGSPLNDPSVIAHGMVIYYGYEVYSNESGNLVYLTNISNDVWYDFKIVLTDSGADYYYKDSSSDTYIFLYSSSGSPLYPEMKVGAGYYVYSDYYAGFNTRNWVVGGDAPTTDLCPGTYDFTVYDASGCSATTTVTITEGTVAVPISPWTLVIAIFLILGLTLFRYRKSF